VPELDAGVSPTPPSDTTSDTVTSVAPNIQMTSDVPSAQAASDALNAGTTSAAPSVTPIETPQWSLPLRYLGLIGALIVVSLLFTVLAPVLDLILLGFVFAFLLHAAAHFLTLHARLGYRSAVIAVYLIIVVVFAGIAIAFASRLIDSLGGLVASVQEAAGDMEAGAPPEGIPPSAAEWLREVDFGAVVQATLDAAGRLMSRLALGLSGVIGFIGLVVTALLFAFMLQLNLKGARGSLRAWIPEKYGRETALLLSKMDQVWTGYIVAGVIFAGALSLVSMVQYALMGVPNPLILGIINGTLALIPSIGGFIGSFIVATVCLVTGSSVFTEMDNLTFAVLVWVVNSVVTQGVYYFIGLPATGRGVRLPVALVLLGGLAGLATGSLLLAWLAVPVIATLKVTAGYLLSKYGGLEPFPGESVPPVPAAYAARFAALQAG
jgi:predicted PurR-regulated permease PerM